MFQPGSARYGNFINYYSFNPSEKRLSLLTQENVRIESFILSSSNRLHCLDIGCNSGVLTKDTYEYFVERGYQTNILGVDIDPFLIQRSQELNEENKDLMFKTIDITNDSDREKINSYLLDNKLTHFKIAFVFSVTMWIHINYGDESLKDFLRYISRISEYILLEPQSWKSYKSAVRRNKKLDSSPFLEFHNLKWRENVPEEICNYLTGNMCKMKIIKHFGHTQWDRGIILFKNN